MYFEIQICNPVIRDCSNEKRETLPSAMRAVFPEAAEDAIMVWNWVPVRINYNCHLSVMMEDLLLMLSDLLQSDQGSNVTSFGANSFRATWSLHWAAGTLTIDAAWVSIAGSYVELLNSRRTLEVPRDEFLSEWKSLLKKVIEAIDGSGIKIDEEGAGCLAVPRRGSHSEKRPTLSKLGARVARLVGQRTWSMAVQRRQ
jgi:hypothetical protein